MFNRAAVIALCVAIAACSPEQPKEKSTASSPAAAPAAAPTAGGPPTVDGVYTLNGCEGEGGCPNRNWRTIEPTALLAERNAAARVVATLMPGEWVSVEAVQTRLVPTRGVVRKGNQDFPVGEVVYQLEYEGEGYVVYWIRGTQRSADEEVQIDAEPQNIPDTVKATLGLWAKVKRENGGQVGWVHEPRFECMGSLAGDANCRD